MNEHQTDEIRTEEPEKEPFIPSPKWKRVMAWILFAVVIVGIINWLLGIAVPNWTDIVKSWF